MRRSGLMMLAVVLAPVVLLAQASAPAPRYAASDKENLRKHIAEEVTVHGVVASVTTAPSGAITFINFKGNARGDFTGIIRKEDKAEVDKGFDGDVAKALKGKNVEITGKVQEFVPRNAAGGAGILQIAVMKPEQIKIVAAAETAPATTEAAK